MIEIINLTTQAIDEKFFKKIAKKILKEEKQEKNDLAIVLTGQERIKKLNKKYRGENKVTDVLSFDYGKTGDVLICLQEVKKNAKKFSFTLEKELTRVLIHGILHLLGYDHEKSKFAKEKMRKKEEYYYGKN